MRGINKAFVLGIGAIIATIASGGIAMIAIVSKTWALWGGIGLLIVAGLLMIALVVMLITKRGIIMSKDKDAKQPNIIKDSKIKAKIERADKATALDINAPTVTDRVEVSLEAKDVKDAAAVRTNQPLNITMSECTNCHRPLPSVAFGVKPSNVKCRFCGHINKIGEAVS